jgi:ATP-dependent DNA helicase RecQ
MARNRKQANAPLLGIEKTLFEELVKLRKRESDTREIAPYMIFDMKVLESLSIVRPIDIDHFKQVEGIEEKKAEDYGKVFTAFIKEFCEKNKLTTNLEDRNKTQDRPSTSTTTTGSSQSSQSSQTRDKSKMTPAITSVYQLFQDGKESVEEISQQRKITPQTILGKILKKM